MILYPAKTLRCVLFRSLFIVIAFLAFSPLQAQTSQLELVYNWRDNSLVPSAAYANTYNEVWGFVQNGTEYGVIGSTWGTHIFDLSDPANIHAVDSVAGARQGEFIVHRDFDDYMGYLYIVCDEGGTLQIVDLSNLPDSVHVVYDSDSLIYHAHNIFIDKQNAVLYALSTGNAQGYNSVLALSIANPVKPQVLGTYNSGGAHDAYVTNNLMYLNNGYGGLLILDWTDPSNVQLVGSLDTYPDQGYNHSGWLSEDGQTYVFADETYGMKMKVCDVSDPTDINVLSLIGSEQDVNSIAHNQILKNNLLYTAYYHDGLWIFDISDPANPVYVADYDTYLAPDHDSYRGAWGVYPLLPSGLILVSDMQTGLYVFRLNMPNGLSNSPISPLNFSLKPNPAEQQVYLSLEQGDYFYELLDIQGRLMQSGALKSTLGSDVVIDLPESLESGVYTVRLRNEQQWGTQKLIKK